MSKLDSRLDYYSNNQSPPINIIPHSIVAQSILPFLKTNDWLSFRQASLETYEFVHGTRNVFINHCTKCQPRTKPNNYNTKQARCDNAGTSESDALWRLALNRDYGFQSSSKNNESVAHENVNSKVINANDSIHSPLDERAGAFLSTKNMFTASNAFDSWKHWRKIDRRLHHRRLPGSYLFPGERTAGPYFLRAALLWRKMEQWCNDEKASGTLGREIKSSLLPGVALDPNLITDDGGEYDAKLSALKAVYAFYAGQDERKMNRYNGFFGGKIIPYAVQDGHWIPPKFDSNSFQLRLTGTIADEWDGLTQVTMSLVTGHVRIFCDDNDVPSIIWEEDHHCPDDAILRWFEEHARRCCDSHYFFDE